MVAAAGSGKSDDNECNWEFTAAMVGCHCFLMPTLREVIARSKIADHPKFLMQFVHGRRLTVEMVMCRRAA
jgi:hypothetical protein